MTPELLERLRKSRASRPAEAEPRTVELLPAAPADLDLDALHLACAACPGFSGFVRDGERVLAAIETPGVVGTDAEAEAAKDATSILRAARRHLGVSGPEGVTMERGLGPRNRTPTT